MMMWIVFLSFFILTVLAEQDEVSRGYVGKNVIMEFSKPSKVSFLYHFDKRVAIIQEHECQLFPSTQFAGRLRCSRDKFSTNYTIIIQNVTQRDAGVYKVFREDTVIERRFLSITEQDEVSRGYVGENVIMEFSKPSKLSFLYHFDKRIAIIQEGECHLFPGTQFAGRLRCSRDKFSTECTIIIQNVTQRDAGVYKVVRNDTVIERRFLNITDTTITNSMNTGTIDARSAGSQLHSVTSRNQAISMSTQSTANEIVTDLKRKSASELETVKVPIYFVPVTIAAFGVMNLMVCLLIWIRRKNGSVMEPERHHALKEYDTNVYLTPFTGERQLPKSMRNIGRAGQSSIAQNTWFDSNMRLLHRTQSLCRDGYDVVDISGMHGLQNASYNEQSIYESSQTINMHIQDESGYLTVLGVLETPV